FLAAGPTHGLGPSRWGMYRRGFRGSIKRYCFSIWRDGGAPRCDEQRPQPRRAALVLRRLRISRLGTTSVRGGLPMSDQRVPPAGPPQRGFAWAADIKGSISGVVRSATEQARKIAQSASLGASQAASGEPQARGELGLEGLAPLLEAMPDPALLIDPEGRIAGSNAAAREQWQFEAAGLFLSAILRHPDVHEPVQA